MSSNPFCVDVPLPRFRLRERLELYAEGHLCGRACDDQYAVGGVFAIWYPQRP